MGETRSEDPPRPGLGALQILVLIEVGEGALDGRLKVLGKPVVGMGGERKPVGPRRPLGYAPVTESRSEDVLMRVDHDLHVISSGPVHDALDLPQIRLAVLAGPRFQVVPEDQ